jgi:hypothetical protein
MAPKRGNDDEKCTQHLISTFHTTRLLTQVQHRPTPNARRWAEKSSFRPLRPALQSSMPCMAQWSTRTATFPRQCRVYHHTPSKINNQCSYTNLPSQSVTTPRKHTSPSTDAAGWPDTSSPRSAFCPMELPFTLVFENGQRHTVRLLSPPGMVVVRDEGGRLQRQQRDDKVDEPRTHSDRFYRLYLARNHLPPWFLRGGHPATLDDTEEADLLGMGLGIHVAGGGIVNPTQIPAGVGHWEWLAATDRDVAEASGFGHSFEDIINARAAGALSLNPDRQDVASVVWYPDSRYFNPLIEPTEPGHWSFLTTGSAQDSDEGFASLQLGGTAGMSNHPTASQIFPPQTAVPRTAS